MTDSNTIPLSHLAHTRSGDKGNHANLGVIAYSSEGYEHLKRHLTAERVAGFFAPLFGNADGQPARVDRFELPGICALNFLLHDVLAGGASRSLRIDTQAKLFSTAALEIQVPAME